MTSFIDYLPLLTLTIATEAAIGWVVSGRKAIVVRDLVLLNLVTHPLATLAVSEGLDWFVAEALVIAVEACGYVVVTRLPRGSAIKLSLICNLVTAAIGYFCF